MSSITSMPCCIQAPGARIVGQDSFAAEPGSIRPVSLTVAAPADSGLSGIRPMDFVIEASDDPAIQVVEKSSFALPATAN